MTRSLSRRTRSALALLAAAAIAVACLPTVGSWAGPRTESSARTVSDAPFVTLEQATTSVPTDGSFAMTATVEIDRPTSYLEARLQIRRASGRLLFQKTEVRSALTTGSIDIGFGRNLADLELEPGAYPVELRVRTQADRVREWIVDTDLLVHAPDPEPVPVVVVVRVEAAPSTDAEGRFSIDPATSTRARDEAVALARAIVEEPRLRVSLAIPPFLLEEWLRVSQGYEHVSQDGVIAVEAESPVPRAYAGALEIIARAVGTGRLELMTVGYALPDLGASDATDVATDLEAHLSRGQSACLAALETTPAAVLYPGLGLLPAGTFEMLEGRDLRGCVVAGASLETTPTGGTGAYAVAGAGGGLVALLLDAWSSEGLRAGETSAVVDAVFTRSISATPTAPVIADVALGPGYPSRTEDLVEDLAALASAPWLRYATASEALSAPVSGEVRLPDTVPPLPDAPVGFRQEVAEARMASDAFLRAVGINDPDGQLANDLSLIAQSVLWAGPDLNWGPADRGRAIAASAEQRSRAVLDSLSLVGSDITLSGTSGEVPISIRNASEKNLVLTLDVSGRGVDAGPLPPEGVQVRPQDNFVSVPVDLGQSLQGDLRIELKAGDVVLDELEVKVRASFLDRLVIIGGAAIVLVGMLLFIRHRVRSATRADTM